MQAWMVIAALIVAAVGQYLNSKPQYPTAVVKIGMALMGPLLYLMVEQPGAPPGNPAFLDWLDKAWIWALALPGAASLLGIAPQMATKTVALVLGCLLFFNPAPLSAQTAPAKVFGAYLGGNAYWHDGVPVDWEPELSAKASLSPNISFVGSGAYGGRSNSWRYAGGLRITATDVNDRDFSIGIGLQYHGSDAKGTKPDEWKPDVTVGYRPWPGAGLDPVILILRGWVGVDSKRAGGLAGVRYSLPF